MASLFTRMLFERGLFYVRRPFNRPGFVYRHFCGMMRLQINVKGKNG